MRNSRTPHRFSAVDEFFRNVTALIKVLILPGRLTPVPVPVRRRPASGTIRRTPATRPTGWLPLLVGFVCLTAVPAWAGSPALPVGVPDIYNPEVRAQFQPVGVSKLLGNPDFPLLYVVNRDGDMPQAMLIGLDARNGKATWSLTSDPIVLIVILSDDTTIQGVYVDTGFANRGEASGAYATVDERNATALPDLLKAVVEAVRQTYI